jgi:hypothetical protein
VALYQKFQILDPLGFQGFELEMFNLFNVPKENKPFNQGKILFYP